MAPKRLVYGGDVRGSGNAIVLDAEVARRWAAGITASTVKEFQERFHGRTWEDYVAEGDYAEQDPDPNAPYTLSDWIGDSYPDNPIEGAYWLAHARVEEIIAESPEKVEDLECDQGDDGWGFYWIVGPIDALDFVASKVDPDRDGFTLERDEDAVQAGLAGWFGQA